MLTASPPKTDTLAGILDRARGAYLGLALGDALGATVEFMTPREIKACHGFHRSLTGGGWLNLAAGAVTDDTTMSLSLGTAIVNDQGRVSAESAARAFSDWMATKPVDCGNTVRRGIIAWRTQGTTAQQVSDFDAGNGACMRSLPVALALLGAGENDLRAASRQQAHVTHNNALSDAGTECVLLMVQEAVLHGTPPGALVRQATALARAYPEFDWRKRRRDNPSGYIVETLQAVFQAFECAEGFEDILTEVVNRGGDADTTGAIAGMIAGASAGADALPKQWIERLNPTIAALCREQAEDLLACSAYGQAR